MGAVVIRWGTESIHNLIQPCQNQSDSLPVSDFKRSIYCVFKRTRDANNCHGSIGFLVFIIDQFQI